MYRSKAKLYQGLFVLFITIGWVVFLAGVISIAVLVMFLAFVPWGIGLYFYALRNKTLGLVEKYEPPVTEYEFEIEMVDNKTGEVTDHAGKRTVRFEE